MKAATKIIRDLRKKGMDFEAKGIYSLKELEKSVDYFDEERIEINGGKNSPKDAFFMKIPIDYVLITVKMEQMFPELKLNDDLDFEVRKDNSVKIRTEQAYTFPINDKVTMGAYFKKFGSTVDFI